ncbi:MAG: hypothetical protein GXP32_04445 [Kiritimatiellaeota bacterium]|nr:hypothetical protein [Kiritimatiellota bacterium]
MLSLPYNANRYYLSGMDWIIGSLNNYMLSTGAAGNHSSLVIKLRGHIPESDLRGRLETVVEKLPLLSGRLKRDFINLAPYWFPRGGMKPDFQIVSAESDSGLREILEQRLNRPFQNNEPGIAFLLVKSEKRDILVMTFDHQLLDARGAELLSRLFSDKYEGATLDKQIESVKTTDAPELREWSAKFAAGRHIQRKIIEMTKKTGCHSPMRGRVGRLSETPKLKAEFHSFDSDSTSKIEADAEKTAGYMMETVYLLAVAAISFHKTVCGNEAEWFFVPVPIDLRKQSKSTFRGLLFNHFSFLFFHFEVRPDSSVETIVRELRGQLLAQIAEEFPERMVAAAYLGRIFPFPLIRRFMRLPFDGKMATFVFANVGNGAAAEKISGVEVETIQHMPGIPSPPGVGIFFSRHSGCLNLTVTSDENNLPPKLGESLLGKITKSLAV